MTPTEKLFKAVFAAMIDPTLQDMPTEEIVRIAFKSAAQFAASEGVKVSLRYNFGTKPIEYING